MARLTLDWPNLFSLLGALQGVFLAGALATKRTNRTANRLLAVMMGTFSVSLATAVYHAAGFEQAFPHFFGIGYPLPFLFGPLVYLYSVTVADRGRRLTARDALHLVPFLATVVAGLPIYLLSGADKVALYHQMQRGELPMLVVVADPLKLVSGVAYTVATLVFLRRHRDRVKDSYSSLERVNLRWLLWLGMSAASIWLLAVAFQFLESSGVSIGPSDDVIALAIAVLVYGIGYMGLRQPEIFRFETAEHRIPADLRVTAERSTAERASAAPVVPPPMDVPPASVEPPAPRYERSGLSNPDAERLESALLTAMDRDQPWRHSDLTLADLAQRLSTTPHKLSEVLNTRLGLTFYDFVNGYRVREVQRRIAAGEARKATMLALALDAGFASKSTFNLVFKKHTSQTPSDYRQAAGM